MDLQMWISVFFLVIMPSGAEAQSVTLTATVGASITFPDLVTERGFLHFNGKPIAHVHTGRFLIEDIYKNRLHLKNPGLFTLSGLQKSDSGVFRVRSTKGDLFIRSYELKVYDPVSVPVVTHVSDTVLQCSVIKTEQTTLSWFKGEERVNTSSSGVLLLTVQLRNNDSEYFCVAENPAESKTVRINITTVCKLNEELSTGSGTVSKDGMIYVYLFVGILLTITVLRGPQEYKKVPLQN